MSTRTYSAGVVTAYGAAVTGGYEGTYSEFCTALGQLADVLEDFEGFSVQITTLAEGSSATASYSDGVLTLGIPKGDKGNPGDVANLADAYDSTKTYSVGDHCTKDGQYKVCIVPITTAEAWNSAHWADAEVGEEISDLRSALNDTNLANNRFILATATDGKAYKYSNATLVNLDVGYVTDFIPVCPNDIIVIPNQLGSTSYAHVFFDANRDSIVGKVYANADNTRITVPSGAYYFRASGYLPKKDEFYVYVYGYEDLIEDVRENANILTRYKQTDNLFSGYTSGYARTSTGGISTLTGWYYSDLIPVEEKTFYRVNNGAKTSYYGHVFFDENYALLAFVTSTGDFAPNGYKILYAPEGAKYLSISGTLADVASQTVTQVNFQTTDKIADMNSAIIRQDVYRKYTLKAQKVSMNGYTHIAFPSCCYYKDNMILSFRESTAHLTPTTESEWGKCALYTKTPYGAWAKVKELSKADFTGLEGEIRDPHVMVTRDGNYLILTAFTTYYNNDVAVHDNLVATLDEDFNIVSYKVFSNVSNTMWGNPLITPSGYLIVGVYGSGGSYVARSTATFTPSDLSGMSLNTTLLTASATEITLGYYNDKLVALIRSGSGTKITKTSNLEGNDGWATAVTITPEVDAPVLLPFYKGDLLFFGGALNAGNEFRYPCVGYLDLDNNAFVSIANIDTEITGYSGYIGIVNVGGENYDTVYYQEVTSGSVGTGLYYKRVNAREVCANINYYL